MTLTRDSLFSSLARHSPQLLKTPIENFSTELLAFLLREIPAFFVEFRRLLQRAGKCSPHCDWLSHSGEWDLKTQYAIQTETGRPKFPDLALWPRETPARKLLLEVKIEAPVSISLDSAGELKSQLTFYKRWLSEPSPGQQGALFLLSKHPVDEDEHCDGSLRWFQLHQLASQLCDSSGLSESHRFCLIHFVHFLEDQGMVPEPIPDMEAVRGFFKIYPRLQSLLGELAPRWRTRLGVNVVPKKKVGEGWDPTGFYLSHNPWDFHGYHLYPALWVEESGIYPLFMLQDLKDKLAPVKAGLERALGPENVRIEYKIHLWIYGLCPKDVFARNQSASEQQELFFVSGMKVLKEIEKAMR